MLAPAACSVNSNCFDCRTSTCTLAVLHNLAFGLIAQLHVEYFTKKIKGLKINGIYLCICFVLDFSSVNRRHKLITSRDIY